jgi:hypothetical protein
VSDTTSATAGHAPDAATAATSGFNLSAWALNHQSFVFFLMAMLALFGLLSYRSPRIHRSPSK